jgi:hypothetical protein
MRTQLISGFLHHLDVDGELGVGEDTSKTEEAVEALPLPVDLKRIIQWSWPQKYGQFGPLEIFDVESILDEDCLEAFLQHSWLPVGKAGNGGRHIPVSPGSIIPSAGCMAATLQRRAIFCVDVLLGAILRRVRKHQLSNIRFESLEAFMEKFRDRLGKEERG